MSIEQSRVIDIIWTEKDGSAVILTATDHLEWGDIEHLMLIQQKLNSYVAYVESGEIFDSYPDAKGKEIRFSLVCQFFPDEEGAKFLERCQEVIENAGFKFYYEINET